MSANANGFVSFDRGVLPRDETRTRNQSEASEQIPAGDVQQEQTRKRTVDERLDQVISVLNAHHERYGFLSDEISNL